MARPTKYTEETINTLLQGLREGKGRHKACKEAGIAYLTFLRWIDDKEKVSFVTQVKQAEREGNQVTKETCEQAIMNAATNNDKPIWQAAAWLLERKFPEEYRNKQEHEHSGKLEIKTSEKSKKKIDDIGDD